MIHHLLPCPADVMTATLLALLFLSNTHSHVGWASAQHNNSGGGTGIDVVTLGQGRVQHTFTSLDYLSRLILITDSTVGTLTVDMVVPNVGWIAFAISQGDLLMPDSLAIMAFPDPTSGTATPQKWDLGSQRFVSAVLIAPESRQTLRDASASQNDTHTRMKFTKLLEEGDEPPITLQGDSYFLYAAGPGNEFGYHQYRNAFKLDFANVGRGIVTLSSPDVPTFAPNLVSPSPSSSAPTAEGKEPMSNASEPPMTNATASPVTNVTETPMPNATAPPMPNTTEPPVLNATEPPMMNTTEPPILISTELPIMNTTEPPVTSTTEPPTMNTTEPPTQAPGMPTASPTIMTNATDDNTTEPQPIASPRVPMALPVEAPRREPSSLTVPTAPTSASSIMNGLFSVLVAVSVSTRILF